MIAPAAAAAAGAGAAAALFEPADIRLLLDLALVAAGRGAVDDTDAIAAGLADVRPALAGPAIARALARLNAGRADEAAMLLRATAPADAAAAAQHQAFLALALQLGGRAGESRRVLDGIAMPDGLATALGGRGVHEPPPAGRPA